VPRITPRRFISSIAPTRGTRPSAASPMTRGKKASVEQQPQGFIDFERAAARPLRRCAPVPAPTPSRSTILGRERNWSRRPCSWGTTTATKDG
jgi:hypothetical protein